MGNTNSTVLAQNFFNYDGSKMGDDILGTISKDPTKFSNDLKLLGTSFYNSRVASIVLVGIEVKTYTVVNKKK